LWGVQRWQNRGPRQDKTGGVRSTIGVPYKERQSTQEAEGYLRRRPRSGFGPKGFSIALDRRKGEFESNTGVPKSLLGDAKTYPAQGRETPCGNKKFVLQAFAWGVGATGRKVRERMGTDGVSSEAHRGRLLLSGRDWDRVTLTNRGNISFYPKTEKKLLPSGGARLEILPIRGKGGRRALFAHET